VGRNAAPTTPADPAFVFADGKALHPDYVTNGAQGDIAILRLGKPATAPVVPLAHPEDATQSAAGVLATITGWGRTAPSSPPADLLQKGSMPIRSAPVCTGANAGYVDASNVCAGYLTGEGFAATGGCKGDSGGPLLVATTDSRTRVQVGTVSYGPDSGCVELDKPIVYMRVSYYLSWIESIAGDLAGPPPTTTTTTTTTTAPPSTTTTVPPSTTTTVPASTTTTTATSTTSTTTTVAVAPITTVTNATSFAAPSSGSSGGSGGSSTLAATGSSGWLMTEFVAWALVVLILGRMTLLVARRPAVRAEVVATYEPRERRSDPMR
jgi:secreted trypsin-like serine protease